MRTVVGNFANEDAAHDAANALSEAGVESEHVTVTTADDGTTTVTAQVDDGLADAAHAILQEGGSSVEETEEVSYDDVEQEEVDRLKDPAGVVTPFPR